MLTLPDCANRRDATNSTFPEGLKAFADKTDWKFQMHNRYWSDNNVYSKENGGKYEFLTEPEPNQMAIPLEQVGTLPCRTQLGH